MAAAEEALEEALEEAFKEAIVAPTEEEVEGVVKMPSTMETTIIPQAATEAWAEASPSPSNLTTY